MSKKKVLTVAIICILIGAALFTLNSSFEQTIPANAYALKSYSKNHEVNVCMHLGSFSNATIKDMRDLGVTWVRIDWIPNEMADFMQTMHANNISVLAIIDINSMRNPIVQWNQTVESILQDPNSRFVDAWEIWNEPNGGAYLPVDTYHDILVSAYAIIKNSTDALVISAGLSPNGNWTLSDLYTYKNTGDFVDYQGVHVYDDINANIASITLAEQISHKPIWVTECGSPSTPSTMSPNYTENGQAQYLDENFLPLISHSKVFWYQLYDEPVSNKSDVNVVKEGSFGLIRVDESRKPAFTTFSVASKAQLSRPTVGIFDYSWYGALGTDWQPKKFVDYPISDLGNYSSSDSTVIRKQLELIQNLGVDFVVLSWWGSLNENYSSFIDNSTRAVFKIAKDNGINLRFAVMVEPYLGMGGSYNYSEIYSYIEKTFVQPYPTYYYKDDKPLICFFNDPSNNPGLTPNGTIPYDYAGFSTKIVGQQNYTQWTYTDLDIYDTPTNLPHTTEISVTARFDDSGFRNPNCTIDGNLTQGFYDKEWTNAMQLWRNGKIDTIMITSWNEYPERTAIEPHHDASPYVKDPYYLYNLTKNYISQIHNEFNAVSYLTSHYNPTVGLIYESEDMGSKSFNGTNYGYNQIYNIYSDNLLAEWALKTCEPLISEEINQTILSYNVPNPNFFEVMFGNRINSDFSNGSQLVINQNDNRVVLAEIHNSIDPLWQQYGNLLIYQSLNCYIVGNQTGAEYYFNRVYQMWDGKGIYDKATRDDHAYANYKLALVLYASKVLNISIADYNQIEAKLWSMQQPNGGITSLADLNGIPIGSANTETTAMALLPYNTELVQKMQQIPESWSWITLVLLVVVSALILSLKHKPKKRNLKKRIF
jgi:hypothetical protein